MTGAQTDLFLILLGFIAVLFTVVIAVVLTSQLKQNKKNTTQNSENLNQQESTVQNVSTNDTEITQTKTQIQILQPTTELETEVIQSDVAQSEVVAINTETAPQVEGLPSLEEVEPNLITALKKTEENFFGRIRRAFLNSDKKVVLEAVEEILYTSDLGPSTVQKLLDVVESELSGKEMAKIDSVKAALAAQMIEILKPVHPEKDSVNVVDLIHKPEVGPMVLMVVGVNGAGKTTSIGKIAAQLASQNHKVLVAAGDTFRAAAGGQLKTWTDRAQAHSQDKGQVEIFWPDNTNDPSAVAFDAITKAKSQGFEFVILDTAGRLHTQSNLMEELKKVKRVMTKVIPEAPHETWIVLDANSGQNALMQAKEFNQALTLTGVVLTKMDGTAKGGVALGVVDQLKIPIKLIGIGEKINHLKSFNYNEYVNSILGQ